MKAECGAEAETDAVAVGAEAELVAESRQALTKVRIMSRARFKAARYLTENKKVG